MDNLFLQCLLYQQQDGAEALVPALIGGTGAGKTARARQFSACKELGLKGMVVMLLNQHLPEDLGGFPRPVMDPHLKREVIEFLLARELAMCIDDPYMILFDEVDKVKPDVVATVLTLCADRLLRGRKLHPKTVIAVAGQPVEAATWLADPTNQAFSARMVWLPVPHNWDYVGKEVGLPLKWLKKRKQQEITLPVMPASPRVIERACKFLAARGGELTNDERSMFLHGCLSAEDADGLLDELGQSAWLDIEAAIVKDIGKALTLVNTGELAANAYPFIKECHTKEALQDILDRVMKEGTTEHRRIFLTAILAGLRKDAPKVGDQVELMKGIPDDVITEMFRKAIVEAKERDENEAKQGATAVALTKTRGKAKTPPASP